MSPPVLGFSSRRTFRRFVVAIGVLISIPLATSMVAGQDTQTSVKPPSAQVSALQNQIEDKLKELHEAQQRQQDTKDLIACEASPESFAPTERERLGCGGGPGSNAGINPTKLLEEATQQVQARSLELVDLRQRLAVAATELPDDTTAPTTESPSTNPLITASVPTSVPSTTTGDSDAGDDQATTSVLSWLFAVLAVITAFIGGVFLGRRLQRSSRTTAVAGAGGPIFRHDDPYEAGRDTRVLIPHQQPGVLIPHQQPGSGGTAVATPAFRPAGVKEPSTPLDLPTGTVPWTGGQTVVTNTESVRPNLRANGSDTATGGDLPAHRTFHIEVDSGEDRRIYELHVGLEPVLVGSAVDAGLRVPGPAQQAAILLADGNTPMVSRIGSVRARLGDLEIGSVGVPITEHAWKLELEGGRVDLRPLIVKPPDDSLDAFFTVAESTGILIAQHSSTLASAIACGDDAEALALRSTQLFTHTSARAGEWAIEASVVASGSRDPQLCVVGLIYQHAQPGIVIAALGLVPEITPLSATGRGRVALHELQSGLVSATVPGNDGCDVVVRNRQGTQVAWCRVQRRRLTS